MQFRRNSNSSQCYSFLSKLDKIDLEIKNNKLNKCYNLQPSSADITKITQNQF